MIGARRLAALAALALVSCTLGQPQSPVTPSPTPNLRAQITPSPTPSPPLDVSLKVAFASIYGRTGESHCPNWFDHRDNVVLTQSRFSYSDLELSRMAVAAGGNGKGMDYGQLDPSLLAVQPGVATAATPGFPPGLMATFRMSTACMFSLEITNTGKVALQIPQAGLHLTGAPIPNPTVYRLVEFCSVLHSTQYCGPTVGGPPPGCSVYGVEVALENRPSGADIMSAPEQVDQSGRACPQPTLSSNQSVTFVIGAYSTDPLIYQAVPVVQVITPTAQGTVPFPQLAAVYAFADASQFMCYRLSGSKFEVWKQGAAAYDFDANSKACAWCV
jgi:hypothetical protein